MAVIGVFDAAGGLADEILARSNGRVVRFDLPPDLDSQAEGQGVAVSAQWAILQEEFISRVDTLVCVVDSMPGLSMATKAVRVLFQEGLSTVIMVGPDDTLRLLRAAAIGEEQELLGDAVASNRLRCVAEHAEAIEMLIASGF